MSNIRKASQFGKRHIIVGQLFIGVGIAYSMRVNMSVGIVAMTDKTSVDNFERFDWDERIKSVLLSSFFCGYILTQVLAGQLSERYGGKIILITSMTLVSGLTMLTHPCASYGEWKLLCALRFLQGLCQGTLFPSCHTLLSKWSPVTERAQMATYLYSGTQFGTVVILATSGVIASSPLGWPSLFYLPAIFGIVWSIVWFFFGANSPDDCQKISAEEREFITDSVGKPAHSEVLAKRRLPTPWKSILTSIPFYSLVFVHSTHNWGFSIMLTEIPTYFKSILKLNIKQNALMSALPFLTKLLMSFVFSLLASYLIRRNWLPLKYSRKIFNSIGHWTPVCALMGLGFISSGDHVGIAVGLLTLAVGMNAATFLGYHVNHIDLAPNFAGTLMGISNCTANCMSILAPLVVGLIVSNENDPAQWRIVFIVAAIVYFIGNLQFIIFGQTEIQPWNDPDCNKGKDFKTVSMLALESMSINQRESH